MFESLKKKLSNVIKNIVKKEEAVAAAPTPAPPPIETAKVQPPPTPVKKETVEAPQPPARQEMRAEEKPAAQIRERAEAPKPKKEEKLVKVSLGTKIRGAVLGSITLKESEIEEFATI